MNDIQADELSKKLQTNFAGRIVRKDLTKKIKEGANVPVYVLEYLLGMYCSSNDDSTIAEGVETVKHILTDNFVRPDEAQKIISKLREQGVITSYSIHYTKLYDRGLPAEHPAAFARCSSRRPAFYPPVEQVP